MDLTMDEEKKQKYNEVYRIGNGEKAGGLPPVEIVETIQPKHEKGEIEQNGANSSAVNIHSNEWELKKEKRRNRSPLLYCKLITSYPKTFFGITLGIHIFMVLLMAVLARLGYDVFPIVFDRIPLDITNNEDYLRGLAWEERNEDATIINRGSVEVAIQSERSQIHETVAWFYESPTGNVFTPENLRKINETETALFSDATFQSKYCYKPDGSCSKPSSIVRFFDGTYSSVDSVFLDPDFSHMHEVLYKATYYNETKKRFSFLLSNHTITETTARCAVIRGSMSFGFPLANYQNETDHLEEQEDKFGDYILKTFLPKIDYYYDKKVGNLNFVYTSESLISVTITSLVFKDMALLIGGLAFIFFFMWLQTGSVWMTGFAVLSIVTSFVATNLVYRYILDFRYIGIFHVLALFIILGIGADDVFVFVDTWKETSHNKYISLAHRMSDCYRRASLAMLYTSLTTAIAFIVSATSPFLGINTFGVFAGILVFVNYCSVIIYFPTVVIMYHLYFEKFRCCCCCPRQPIADMEGNNETDDSANNTHHRKHPIVRFFKGPYYEFVTHDVIKWIILALFVVKLGVFAYFCSKIEVNEEQTKFLPDSTNVGKFIILNGKFGTGDRPQKVYLIFGLKQQDLSQCHDTDVSCKGTSVWDDAFNLNENGTQQALLDLCHTIKSLPSKSLDELFIRRDSITQQPEVHCFIEAMHRFMDEEAIRMINVSVPVPRYPNGTEFTFPYDESDAMQFMHAVPYIYNSSLLPEDYENWFEVASSLWLYNGFQPGVRDRSDFMDYNKMIGEAQTTDTISKTVTTAGNSFSYKYGTRLRYAAISVNTTISPRTLGYPLGMPIKDKWEEFMQEQIARFPTALKGGFQTTPDENGVNLWHWLQIQKTLVSSAVMGVGIGLACAAPILIIATMNIITGLMATLTIAAVTLCVIGFIPILGWKLGMLESLNLVLVVGLAVDYCVHLAEGYSRSVHNDRRSRLKDTLEEVGISVLSGACTTLGASFFLLFATILFFKQFGIFMFCTIALSILYSLMFFITLLGIIGPENDFGSLRPLFRKCFNCC